MSPNFLGDVAAEETSAASCKIDHDGCLKTEQFVAGFHGREDIF